MQILKNSPGATEIAVERAEAMRFAERGGGFEAFSRPPTRQRRQPMRKAQVDALGFCTDSLGAAAATNAPDHEADIAKVSVRHGHAVLADWHPHPCFVRSIHSVKESRQVQCMVKAEQRGGTLENIVAQDGVDCCHVGGGVGQLRHLALIDSLRDPI